MKTKIISGIMVTVFLVTMLTVAFPARVSASTGAPVVIGLVGPMGWIQWDGIKEGVQLAADLINNAPANDKGMWDGSQYHLVRLVEIDERAVPVPDPIAAVTGLLNALDENPTMQFLIGGFRTECVLPMREAAMDYAAQHDRPIWIICGATTDQLIYSPNNPWGDVASDYERYKYMFRAWPMNTTSLDTQLGSMMGQLVIPKLKGALGIPPTSPLPTYLIAENLPWVEQTLATLESSYLQSLLGYTVVGVGRPSAWETDYGPFFDAIKNSTAKLIFHIFSAATGASFIKQWGERKVPAMPIGVNVESQMQEFYSSVGGKCEYETILSALGTRSNINPNAKPLSTVEFWDQYSAKYGHAPIYTAWGAYDTLISLNSTALWWIGRNCSWIISQMENGTIGISQGGLLGLTWLTRYHDILADAFAVTPIWPPYGWPKFTLFKPTVRAHMPQWQAGKLQVVWPRGSFPAPGSLAPIQGDGTPLPWAGKWKIPPWVYSLGETDFAGGPIIPIPPEPIAQVQGRAAGYFGYFPSPDRSVGTADMAAVCGLWQKTCVWALLEADMDGNQYIDIDDVARVALDWGKSVPP